MVQQPCPASCHCFPSPTLSLAVLSPFLLALSAAILFLHPRPPPPIAISSPWGLFPDTFSQHAQLKRPKADPGNLMWALQGSSPDGETRQVCTSRACVVLVAQKGPIPPSLFFYWIPAPGFTTSQGRKDPILLGRAGRQPLLFPTVRLWELETI